MPSARRKAPRQEAPQTTEDATALTARYIGLLDRIDAERIEAQAAIDKILEVRDAIVKPLEEDAKAIFRQLRPWWAANRDALTDGKRKSIELAGAHLGERTTTPSLSLPKGLTLAQLLDFLIGGGRWGLIRTKHAVDKPACIRALRQLERPLPNMDAEDNVHVQDSFLRVQGDILTAKGETVSQRDEFFIDRAGRENSEAEQVEVEDVGGAA